MWRLQAQGRTKSTVEWHENHIVAPRKIRSVISVFPANASLAAGPSGANLLTPSDFVLPATDNYPLAARLWASHESSEPVSAALINAGAGIAMRYYDRFAGFLAASGVPTLIYDYRGIGKSRPQSLRGFPASVEDWGSKDCTVALEWLASRFP